MTELGHLKIIDLGRAEDGPACFSLAGEIDLTTSPDLRQALFSALDAGAPGLALDMAAVELIDATGIGVVVAAANRAQRAGGTVTLRSPSSAVCRVLGAIDLDGIVRLQD